MQNDRNYINHLRAEAKRRLPPRLDPFLVTPSVTNLDSRLNPFVEDDVLVSMVEAYRSPVAGLKFWPTALLLLDASVQGRLRKVDCLVEGSSGNTAYALAVLAPYFGVAKLHLIVPADIPETKLARLRLFGPRVTITPSTGNAVAEAQALGSQPGCHNLGQYGNAVNSLAHSQIIARSIWEAGYPGMTFVAAALGTTGTACGWRDFLEGEGAKATVIGAHCAAGNNPVPGARSLQRLAEVSLDWQHGITPVAVEAKAAYASALQLNRAGWPVGPSSGLALAGLYQFLTEAKQNGQLDRHRHPIAGAVVAVVVCGDDSSLYYDKFTTWLDAADFA